MYYRGSEFCYVPLKNIDFFFVLAALAGLYLQTMRQARAEIAVFLACLGSL